MANNEHLPVDPNVKVPGKVAAASAAADAIHKQAYNTPDPPVTQPDPPSVVPPVTGAVTDPPQPPIVAAPPPPAPVPDAGEPGSWEHRYHSMKGRFDQSQVMIGTMQEQMSQMGDELMRSQRSYMDREAPPPRDQQQPPSNVPAHIRLTDADVQTYGPELIGLIQRAALDAVSPELGKTVSAVKQVAQKAQQTANLSLYQVLDRDVPDWRTLNVDPAFKVWCSLPDVYSGVLKGNLLRNAFQAADAPRVVAFFKGYKAEQQATGQLPVPAQGQQQDTAPRQASVALESLVAPGRAKPAPGDSAMVAAEKPIFTRAMIQNFYRNVTGGYYSGREADKARDEAMIFAAQREGRVRG